MRIALLSSDPAVMLGDGHSCPVRMRGLALALSRAGHEITCIAAAVEPGQGELMPELPVRNLRTPVSVREIDWHFSRVGPEVVIERYVPGSLEGVRAAAEAGIPHVYDIDGPLDAGGLATSSAVRGALPEAFALSRAAIASSDGAASRVRGLLGRAFPLAVVPNAAGAEFLEPPAPDLVGRIEEQLCLQDGALRVGFFGSLGAESGLLPLVEAMGSLGGERRPRLLVVGDGPERNPALRVAEASRASLVLCGRVAHRDVAAHLALCQIVVAPAGPEGSAPLSMLEAMAMQLAVVAPATDGVRAVARDGHDACLFPSGDVAALASALRSLAGDPARRARLGNHARETVRARHTWESRTAEVEEFLREVRGVPESSANGWTAQPLRRAFSG